MSDYEAQAQKFLSDFGLSFKAAFKGDKCPRWCDDGKHTHGDLYRVTLKRWNGPGISFDFWNSLHDKQLGKAPTAYDVLACISSDFYCPEDFTEFCLEYGYDEDSRKAHATFKAADKFSRKLRSFFSENEAERLSEIR